MRNGTYYLNNSGSRFVNFVNGRHDRVLVFHGAEGYCKKRSVCYYEMFGNGATAHVRYKGKMVSGFLEYCSGTYVLFIDYTEKYR